jgi:hypothetical protein
LVNFVESAQEFVLYMASNTLDETPSIAIPNFREPLDNVARAASDDEVTAHLPNAIIEAAVQNLAGSDDNDISPLQRERELNSIGDAARQFLAEKRAKFERLSALRAQRFQEMYVFIVFLVLVCVVAVLARSTLSSNMQTLGMHDYLAEEAHSSSNKSNVKLNMAGHGAFDDVREWLQSVFHRQLYSGNSGAPYFSDGSARLLPILGNNMVLGSVQLRQLRLKTFASGSHECQVPSLIHQLNPSCYPEFSSSNEERGVLSEYLALWEAQNNRSSSQAELPWAWWTPHSDSFKSSNIFSHLGLDYPNGGYILKMPKDPEAGRLALANLYLDLAPQGWLKSNTSAALLTEWVLYVDSLIIEVFTLHDAL